MQPQSRMASRLLTATVGCVLVALAALAPVAEGQILAQVPSPAAADELGNRASDTASVADWFSAYLMPSLHGPALTWFAVVVILLLSVQLKPLVCRRNLDALVLAGTCLLLALRVDATKVSFGSWDSGHTGQWWSYLLLTVAAGYWLLRGFCCLTSKTILRHECNVSESALLILVLAGLTVGIGHLATAPLSQGSRDGIVGGLCVVETGKLPYGEVVGHDSRSPLLYLVHAGAVKLRPPQTGWTDDDELAPLEWQERDTWLAGQWWRAGDYAAARIVNAALFILFLLALHTIGRRLHSVALGLTMVTIFCVLPATAECIPRPEIMLPATLLSWAVAVALVPGIGGVASGLLIVMAGFAWPWAWLALPVLLGYFFRRGWEAAGVLVGTLGGIAASLAGLVWMTQPTLPRADAALYRAELHPTYVVSRSDDGSELMVALRDEPGATDRAWLRPFWRFLVDSENLTLDASEAGANVTAVNFGDVVAREIAYRDIEPADAARGELTERYRAAMATQPNATRMWVAIRTALEHTWLATDVSEEPLSGAWSLWSTGAGDGSSRLPMIRKVSKLLAGVVAVLIGLIMLRGARPRPRHLVGGLLVVSSATLLVSDLGAVTNIVWMLPTLLALWAANEPPPAPRDERPLRRAFPDVDGGLPPRISVEQ